MVPRGNHQMIYDLCVCFRLLDFSAYHNESICMGGQCAVKKLGQAQTLTHPDTVSFHLPRPSHKVSQEMLKYAHLFVLRDFLK